jgi:hypothetical protein
LLVGAAVLAMVWIERPAQRFIKATLLPQPSPRQAVSARSS